ncbi:nucleotidyltransferase family protein [Brachybacterium sp. J144]|uniref:nucleotidyltransferase family protein n=1 Tax=Brachybacterium sp. J144 TaxID=3116487 RepID=UPI002E775D83|nr:nucleotidyltransferase family protein [Brachybacterium sp. J144]MEE1650079.1 nucleotidyltransferase family protein [Brachybacterium sp. J144]
MSAASFAVPRLASAPPVGLILAAGAGRRLGRGPKALLLLRGAPLVEHVARALRDGGCAEVVVVTGADSERVGAVLDGLPWARTEQNPRWREGMGTSLRTGLAAIGAGRDVLVTPVDRPGTCAAEVARVLSVHRPGGITAAAHREASGGLRRGHPVLLDAAWTAAAAEAAHADVGARDLLRARRDHVQLVDCTDLDDGADLDLPEDLWRLDVPG